MNINKTVKSNLDVDAVCDLVNLMEGLKMDFDVNQQFGKILEQINGLQGALGIDFFTGETTIDKSVKGTTTITSSGKSANGHMVVMNTSVKPMPANREKRVPAVMSNAARQGLQGGNAMVQVNITATREPAGGTHQKPVTSGQSTTSSSKTTSNPKWSTESLGSVHEQLQQLKQRLQQTVCKMLEWKRVWDTRLASLL